MRDLETTILNGYADLKENYPRTAQKILGLGAGVILIGASLPVLAFSIIVTPLPFSFIGGVMLLGGLGTTAVYSVLTGITHLHERLTQKKEYAREHPKYKPRIYKPSELHDGSAFILKNLVSFNKAMPRQSRKTKPQQQPQNTPFTPI